jgi:hypothetical protein
LKIRVSMVQFHPWPPIQISALRFVADRPPRACTRLVSKAAEANTVSLVSPLVLTQRHLGLPSNT